MLNALSVTEDVYTISLIQTVVKSCSRVLVDKFGIGFGTGLEQKDISTGVPGTQVNVAENTGSDTCFGTV